MAGQKLANEWYRFDFSKDWYNKNKERADQNLLRFVEDAYPTPIYKNDIAGFISIRIENPIEGIRIIGEVWGIENRKIKSRKVFRLRYGEMKVISKDILIHPGDFNRLFFQKVENIISSINKKYLRKKKFHFSLNESQMNWELIKTANIAMILIDNGPNWIY